MNVIQNIDNNNNFIQNNQGYNYYYDMINNDINNVINNNNNIINNNQNNLLNDNRLRELLFNVVQNNVNQYINDVAQAAQDAADAAPVPPVPAVPLEPVADIPQIVEDVSEDRQLNKCSICLDNNVAIVFNCGHLCSCNACSARLDRCPICRVEITRRQRVFFS